MPRIPLEPPRAPRRRPSIEDIGGALQDMDGMLRRLGRHSLRRTVPRWPLATEIWRMLAHPQRIRSATHLHIGIGAVALPKAPWLIVCSVRTYSRPPKLWIRAQAVFRSC